MGGHDWQGSIPARAGEPAVSSEVVGRRGVYPRACGGTAATRRESAAHDGLSPRVRGNPLPTTCPPSTRSIPARAGEPHDMESHLPTTVYPRACGGTTWHRTMKAVREGLSPRVRGNLPHQLEPTTRHRSIPARAGEPRHRKPWALIRSQGGSGSIPARAGEPPAHQLSGHEVYPRACGGTNSIPARAGEPVESSVLTEVYPRACGGIRMPPW